MDEKHPFAFLRAAVRAPSSHNTQPWRFRLSEQAIDLFADRTRALPVNDPQNRELTLSCGCALMNVRLAALAAGFAAHVEPLPDPEDRDFLARVTLEREAIPCRCGRSLVEGIERRRTYRRRFAPREVPANARNRLVEAARVEGASLRPLLSALQRKEAAALVAQGDAAQWANPSWRRELAAWMQPRKRGDGLTVPGLVAPIARFIVRSFDMGGAVGGKDRQLAESSPLLAVLCTEEDTPRAWLAAGQALQRVLLEACRFGLHASYLNQPVQVASLRPRLAQLTGGGFPQVLLRLGYPEKAVAAAPRRPLDDVVEVGAGGPSPLIRRW